MPRAKAPEPQDAPLVTCSIRCAPTERLVIEVSSYLPERTPSPERSAGGRIGHSAFTASGRSGKLAMSSKQGLLGQIDAIGAEAFHILLVEDDELTLKVTEGLLRHCNYQGVKSWRRCSRRRSVSVGRILSGLPVRSDIGSQWPASTRSSAVARRRAYQLDLNRRPYARGQLSVSLSLFS